MCITLDCYHSVSHGDEEGIIYPMPGASTVVFLEAIPQMHMKGMSLKRILLTEKRP